MGNGLSKFTHRRKKNSLVIRKNEKTQKKIFSLGIDHAGGGGRTETPRTTLDF